MDEIFFILLVIGYIFTLTISMFSVYSISIHYSSYGTKLMTLLNLITIIFTGFIFSTLFFFSIVFYPSELLWKVTMVFGFLSLGNTGLIYAFLLEYKKIPVLPLLCYTTFLGLIIGSLFFFDSIQLINNSSRSFTYLITDISNVNYVFEERIGLIITVFLFLMGFYYVYFSFRIYFNSRDKQITKWFVINTLLFCVPLFMFILYVRVSSPIFRELYILLLWINYISVAFMLIKKPDMFLVLTNKIYNINIYHKSGILLYSYKFEQVKPISDSVIWGNILIGLNHILSEFIDKKDKIDVMKTEMLDIVVNYNIDYGFAVLVITNQKNDILQKFLNNFTYDFEQKYENELSEIQDLNKIINIADFKDTKEIIEKNFKVYF